MALDPLQLPDPPEARPNSDLAEAWAHTAGQFQAWRDLQRQQGIDAGLIDPETGWPTEAGYKDIAGRIAGGFGDGGLLGITRRAGGPAFTLQRVYRRPPPGEPRSDVFLIKNPAGEHVATVDTIFDRDTNNLHVNSIDSDGGPNSLGLPAIAQIRQQLLDLYPAAKTLSGERVSGANPDRYAVQELLRDRAKYGGQ